MFRNVIKKSIDMKVSMKTNVQVGDLLNFIKKIVNPTVKMKKETVAMTKFRVMKVEFNIYYLIIIFNIF